MKIITLTPADITHLMLVASEADARGLDLKVATDGDAFMVKLNNGMWSAPMGTRDK